MPKGFEECWQMCTCTGSMKGVTSISGQINLKNIVSNKLQFAACSTFPSLWYGQMYIVSKNGLSWAQFTNWTCHKRLYKEATSSNYFFVLSWIRIYFQFLKKNIKQKSKEKTLYLCCGQCVILNLIMFLF